MKLTGKIFIPHNDGKPNKNGHIYPKEVIEEIVEKFNNLEKPMFGHLGYPSTTIFDIDDTTQQPSHKITSVREEDVNLIGDIEILDTPNGDILKSIIDGSVIRPLVEGSVNEDGTINVTKIRSFDVIPKSNDAFNRED